MTFDGIQSVISNQPLQTKIHSLACSSLEMKIIKNAYVLSDDLDKQSYMK